MRLNFDGPVKSEVLDFQIAKCRLVDILARDLKFVLALEPKVLKLRGLILGNQGLHLYSKGVIQPHHHSTVNGFGPQANHPL